MVSDLKREIVLEQEQVTIAREKLQKILQNFAQMGYKAELDYLDTYESFINYES